MSKTRFTNSYMLIYSLALAAIVAVLLTVVSQTLKSRQQTNVRNEKMQSLLAAIHISCDASDAEATYRQYFVEELTIATDGSVLSRYDVAADKLIEGDTRAFNIKLKEQQRLEQDGGKGAFPVYRYQYEGRSGYVVPTQGNGLWGAVYANIALADDFNTIVGVTFSHDSETPGLGAEISADAFQSQFAGKQILDEAGEVVSVSVVKRAEVDNPHQVDAISGGTMTSNGVSVMLLTDLTRYQNYIKQVKNHHE